jgi:hypothetical protein
MLGHVMIRLRPSGRRLNLQGGAEGAGRRQGHHGVVLLRAPVLKVVERVESKCGFACLQERKKLSKTSSLANSPPGGEGTLPCLQV